MKVGDNEYQRAQYAKHREKRLAAKRKSYWENPDKMRERNKRQYYANQETRILYARNYRLPRREQLAAEAMERYCVNREEIRDRRRKAYRETPEIRAKAYAAMRAWLKANPEKALIQHAKRLINEATGIAIRDIPRDIAEAKAEQLKITRWVREQLAASGMEARRAATEDTGAVHDSPTAATSGGDARNTR